MDLATYAADTLGTASQAHAATHPVTHIALGRVYSALDAYADRKGASKEMLHRAKLYARTVLQGNANTAPRSAAWAITEGRAVIDAGLSRTSLTREPLPPTGGAA
jgi:hypothetical protein